ncbi:MAG: hypothetical protein ABFD07_17695 [Methanobacterium sp.]
MSMENTILISNVSTPTQGNVFSYSEKKQAVGYHQLENGIHTAVYEFNEAVSHIKLQATLEVFPGESDWFDIKESDYTTDETIQIHTFTIMGNFVWVRAAYQLTSGTISSIRLI